MWNEGYDRELNNDMKGRSSTSSEVVIIDEEAMGSRALTTAAASIPTVGNMNVSKSSTVHIGPKFVSVTQNVHNSEVVKDLPFPCFLYNIVKHSTRVERLSCAVALIALATCIGLIVYFSIAARQVTKKADLAPHEWNITREMWLAKKFDNPQTTEPYEPLRLVIIQNTVSQECHTFANCAAELRTLQSYFINSLHYDIPYNFMIGNEGRVYQGRGWHIVGAHTLTYNNCSLGIGFIGDYREELPATARVSELQIKRTKMLLQEGVELGYLHPEYYVVGAKDLRDTESPGSNLYNAIRKWEHYDHNNRFRNKSCQQIYAMLKNETLDN